MNKKLKTIVFAIVLFGFSFTAIGSVNPDREIKTTSFLHQAKKVYKLKSTICDIEKNGNIVKTSREISYHIFDFNKRQITFKSLKNGKWTEYTYKMKKSYKEEGLFATTHVITIGEKGVKEIWFSIEANNLGYDLNNGTRLAFYNVTQIK